MREVIEKYYCDICGKEVEKIKENKYSSKEYVPLEEIFYNDEISQRMREFICHDCMFEISLFIRRLKRLKRDKK